MSKVLNPWLFFFSYLEPVVWPCSNWTRLQARRLSPCRFPPSCTGGLWWGLSVVPEKTEKKSLQPSQPKFCVCSGLGFFDIFIGDLVFCSCNAFAEGHCNNLWLFLHRMTVFLHQSSTAAHHEAAEGDVLLATNGSIGQRSGGNAVIPKDAFGTGLSPVPTIPNLFLA